MFSGSLVAIITPFDRHGNINLEKLKELIDFHVSKGTSGIVLHGTTGENPTLSLEERKEMIRETIEYTDKRLPIIIGTGTNSTLKTIEMTKYAENAGADGALVITPYYNKPTQEGMYQHFKMVASKCHIPIIVYNVPSRTGVNITPETLSRLSKIDNIVGVKEASGNLVQVSHIRRLSGDHFTILSGDDPLTLPMLALGAKGVISVTANLIPDKVAEMIKRWESGEKDKALKLHEALLPVHESMFIETNPQPVKTAMNLAGMDVGGFRLPLTEMKPENVERMAAILKKHKVLE